VRLRHRIVVLLLGSLPPAVLANEAEWTRTSVGLLSLEAPAGHERVLSSLASRAAEILPRVEEDLGIRAKRRYRMVLIPTGLHRDSALARLDALAPPWAAGFMMPSQRLGAIRAAQAARYPYGTLESVLAHEVAHLLLHDAAAQRLPPWFQEGVATWVGRRWSLEDAMVYSGALLTTSLPRLAELEGFFDASAGEARLAYATSFSFVSWSIGRHGPTLPREVVRAAHTLPFAEAWRAVTGGSLADAEASWRRSSLIRFRWIPALMASSTLWIGITFLAVLAGIRRRARARRVREQWAREEDREEIG